MASQCCKVMIFQLIFLKEKKRASQNHFKKLPLCPSPVTLKIYTTLTSNITDYHCMFLNFTNMKSYTMHYFVSGSFHPTVFMRFMYGVAYSYISFIAIVSCFISEYTTIYLSISILVENVHIQSWNISNNINIHINKISFGR